MAYVKHRRIFGKSTWAGLLSLCLLLAPSSAAADAAGIAGKTAGIVALTLASVGSFIGGGMMLSEASDTLTAVDRGRAGHMTQGEAFDLEAEARREAIAGYALVGVGSATTLAGVGLLVSLFVGLGDDDDGSFDDDYEEIGFAVAPLQQGAAVSLYGVF